MTVTELFGRMTRKATRPVIGGALFALLVSGCTGGVTGENWANFTVRDQYVYVAYKDVVFRVDTSKTDTTRSDEKLVDWAAQSPNKTHMYGPPAIAADGKVIVGAFDKDVYAFSPNANPRNAAISTFDTPTATDKYVGAAAVAGETVYIGTGDRGVSAFSLATGALQPAQFRDTKFGIWATPIIDEATKTVYVAALDHNVYALNQDDLSIRWKIDCGGQLSGTPLLADGKLYVGTFNSGLLSIDTATGNIANRFSTSGWIWATPVIFEGTLYFGDLSGYVYALDPLTFQQKWKTRDEAKPGAIRGSVAIADGKLFVGSESKVMTAYTLDAGAKVWSQEAPDKILSDLAVIGQDVVFTTLNEDSLVMGMNIQTGQRSWKVTKPNDDKVKSLLAAPITMPQ